MKVLFQASAVTCSLFLWAYLLQGVKANCVPDCTGRVEGDKTGDPTNCLRYYYCSDPEGLGNIIPSNDPLTCPDGQYFNDAITVSECEDIVPGQDYCSGLCNPCRLKCTEPGTLIPNPANCNKFFICLQTEILEDNCPISLPYFDYQEQVCTTNPNRCYDLCDVCNVYCTEEGKVPDPYDCHGYYYCSPPDLAQFTCPNNEVFNPITLFCEESTSSCSNTC